MTESPMLASGTNHGERGTRGTINQRTLILPFPRHPLSPWFTLLAIVVLMCAAIPAGAQSPPKDKDRLEQSVDKALVFLNTMQESDGSWQVHGQKSPAVTSLAVMAFLSAGHVPDEGPYGEAITKGIRWVLSRQQP